MTSLAVSGKYDICYIMLYIKLMTVELLKIEASCCGGLVTGIVLGSDQIIYVCML